MATLDHITLAEAKSAINIPSGVTTHDTELAQFITAISGRIDDLCGPVVSRSVTELHDGGRSFFRPSATPVLTVTTLTEYLNTTATVLSAESNASKPVDGYLLVTDAPHLVKILRRSAGVDHSFPVGRSNVELVFAAGRYANTAAVDPQFKQAAAMFLQHMWKPSAGAWTQAPAFMDAAEQTIQSSPVPAWAVPRAVKDLLWNELRVAA